MPRIDFTVTGEHGVPYEIRLVLALLIDEVNALRQQAGLPQRTQAQIRAAVRQWMRLHPRAGA